ncbi:MAG: hypothetical protein IT381_30755 [Deltaproteobacteria bacterium]|nr:hypothetical protein [Deltaproteobacteria bacterium]
MPEAGAEKTEKIVQEVVVSGTAISTRSGANPANDDQQKTPAKRSGVVVSERDLDLFEWVAEHRFSTKELLVERFYSDPTKLRAGTQASGQYGAVRLRALLRDGYLRPSRYRILRVAPLLVSDVGYRLLHGLGRVPEYRALPDIDIENFEHDVWVQRLRIAFERDHGCKNWSTERALKLAQQERQLPYLPDGRFNSADGQAWNLEVERTPKRLDRLKELLSLRARTSRKTRVLYVLDRRFSEFYRAQMAVTENPAVFHIAHFDDLATAHLGGNDWAATSIAQLFGGNRV